jgi:hypothetical protein
MSEAGKIELRVWRSFAALYAGLVRELAFFGREVPDYWWDALEHSVRLLLAWADLTAAAKLRFAGTQQRTKWPSDVLENVIDANQYLQEHVKQSNPIIEFRAKMVRQAECAYLMKRAIAQKHRHTALPSRFLPDLAEWRSDRVRRDTVGEIINVSQQIELCDPLVSEMFPFARYLSRDDRRVRPTHQAMHGFIAIRSWDKWPICRPKNGYGCRCFLRFVARFEAKKMGWLHADGRPRFTTRWPNVLAEKNFELSVFPDPGWHGPKLWAPYGPLPPAQVAA